ncbi:hypothetical protein [Streptomyces sp. NBC_01643]|nr:hypothetical protein OHB03_04290 [Streptomyces sp. NBC_01643]
MIAGDSHGAQVRTAEGGPVHDAREVGDDQYDKAEKQADPA